MILPGQSLLPALDDKTREALAGEISLVIDDLEATYNTLFNDISIWWANYEATPRIKGPKNWPFKNASNIIVPLIQIMTDAFVNQVYATIHGHGRRIWLAQTENESIERQIKNIGRYINHAANNNDFNMRLTAYDWILEMAAIGSSVIGINWRTDQRWVYAPTRGSKALRALPVNFARGPLVEHIPREQILWDTAFLIQEAPVVVREFEHPWSHLRNLAALDDSWDAKATEQIRGRGDPRGPSQKIKQAKDQHDSKAAFDLRDLRTKHDIREVHLDWPMLNAMGFDGTKLGIPGNELMETPSPPIVVTLDRNTKEILRCIAEPYFAPYKPFFDIYYRKRSGRGGSAGIAKKLEHMQIGMTTGLNQAFDARTRANSVWARTNRKDYLTKPIDPAHPIYAVDENGFAPLNLPSAIFDDMRLLTAVQVIAERQVGQSDPLLGRETRSGGHPSPATSTLALMDQAGKMSGTTKELLRIQYSRMGEFIASLYQQFGLNKDGTLQRTFGLVDAKDIESWMFPTDPIIGNATFDLVAVSENLNPDTEMRRAVLVTQMNTNYWAFVLRAFQSMAQVPQLQAPPQLKQILFQGAIQSIQAQTKAHLRFLEAGDVDDIERFVLQLSRNEQATSADIGAAAGAAREIAESRVGPEISGVAGGSPSNAGNGAAGPIRGFGG
jgi:hypothetical protein